MPRNGNDIETSTTCADGINYDKDHMRPNQCADALNVWCPAGEVVQRPGYIGVGAVLTNPDWTLFTKHKTYGRDTSEIGGAGEWIDPVANQLDLSGLLGTTAMVEGDYWYIGCNSTEIINGFGAKLLVFPGQDHHVRANWSYYDGTIWKHLNVVQLCQSPIYKVTNYDLDAAGHIDVTMQEPAGILGTANLTLCYFWFVPPNDWPSATFHGDSANWIRAKFHEDFIRPHEISAFAASGAKTQVTCTDHRYENGEDIIISRTTNYNGTWEISAVAANTFEIDTAFVADNGYGTCVGLESTDEELGAVTIIDNRLYRFYHLGEPKGIWQVQFSGSKRLLSVLSGASGGPGGLGGYYGGHRTYSNMSAIKAKEFVQNNLTGKLPASPIPASIAVVPGFDEAFIAFAGEVTVHRGRPTTTDLIKATVEERDFAVGVYAPYDKEAVAQLGSFPTAKFISFFQNRLWAIDHNEIVYWTGQAPYHKVWPALAQTPLSEDDNSPTTGMKPLHEAQVIYKNDSIWTLDYDGLGAFDIPQYRPVKRVSGTGCVANNSIKSIAGEHFFLGENGVYAFNGASVRRLTDDPYTGYDRLPDFFKRVSPGFRHQAAAAHWKEKKAYLLSLPLDGSQYNDHVLVYQYDRGVFWLWDNIPAQFWVEAEGSQDEEILYFGDRYGRLYRLSDVDHDHGSAISCSVLTRRLGYKDHWAKTLRRVEVESKNEVHTLNTRLLQNGKPVQTESDRELDFTSVAENFTGSYTFGDALFYLMDRIRHRNARKVSNHVQVRLASAGAKGKPFSFSNITARFIRKRTR